MSHPDADISLPPPSEPWHPSYADLADWAKVLLADCYLQRPRQKCSNDDFMAAAIVVFLALGWRSAFRPEVDVSALLRRRAFPLPGIVEVFVTAGPRGLSEDPEVALLREGR